MTLLICLLLAPVVRAETIVSTQVSDVSVTIYRAPYRGRGAMDRNWPGGYALISETRTISLPAGETVVRFEGVAEGLLPETAIVTGLPNGVREKNRDARLISPAGLVDAFLKRRVRLTRTNRATGKVTQGEAIVQAGPNGGVVLTTADGIEALGCAGLPERMLYDRVPSDLSARPTLSVLTTSSRPVTATVQLTYMAQGFDWSASYVARMNAETKKLGLFAWLTLANGGAQSFTDARLQVVAGQPRKEANARPLAQASPVLRLRCWPLDTTSTHPVYSFQRLPWPLDFTDDLEMASSDNIVVTAQRRGRSFAMAPPPPPPPAPMEMAAPAMVAQQEELGDLKLYRVPERVTVAAQAQKQVAMIDRPEAVFARLYSVPMQSGGPEYRRLPLMLRGTNSASDGLGLPLPAGDVAVFETVAGRDLLVGTAPLADLAIDQQVELALGESADVQWRLVRVRASKTRQEWRAEFTNARAVPVTIELIVPDTLEKRGPEVKRGRGGWILPVEVADNGTASIGFTLRQEAASGGTPRPSRRR